MNSYEGNKLIFNINFSLMIIISIILLLSLYNFRSVVSSGESVMAIVTGPLAHADKLQSVHRTAANLDYPEDSSLPK